MTAAEHYRRAANSKRREAMKLACRGQRHTAYRLLMRQAFDLMTAAEKMDRARNLQKEMELRFE